jgi:hypothetical protein
MLPCIQAERKQPRPLNFQLAKELMAAKQEGSQKTLQTHSKRL